MGHSLIFCAPIISIAFVIGQVSLLWAAVLVAALLALQRDRVVAAGFLISMLSLKPQLGILIPLALAGGGRWRVILWACVWVLILHGAATVSIGIEHWAHFIEALAQAAEALKNGETNQGLMVSFYAFIRFIGFAHSTSLASQWLLTALLAAGLFLLWKQPTAQFDLKASALCIAIPLATLYSFFYELTLSVPAVIFLVRSGIGAKGFDRVMLGLLIFGPATSWVLGDVNSVFPLYAPLLLLVFGRCLAQAFWPDAPGRCSNSEPELRLHPEGGFIIRPRLTEPVQDHRYLLSQAQSSEVPQCRRPNTNPTFGRFCIRAREADH